MKTYIWSTYESTYSTLYVLVDKCPLISGTSSRLCTFEEFYEYLMTIYEY